MKKNIEYYPHHAGADQHAKFKMLRVEYGWEGEGKFWALNNRIAMADECCLDISKKYNKAAIASDLSFTLVEFDKFINFLLNDCELLIECQEGTVTTDIIQETFVKVMRDRGEARERYRRASAKKQKTSGEKIYKVKESKVKERKRKKKVKDKKNNFGTFNNVLLTEEEFLKLNKIFPGDIYLRIDKLSEYIEQSGKKYKNHYATLLSWARKDGDLTQPVDEIIRQYDDNEAWRKKRNARMSEKQPRDDGYVPAFAGDHHYKIVQ